MAHTSVLSLILLVVTVVGAGRGRQKINDKAACSDPEGLVEGLRTKLIDGSVYSKRKSWLYKHGAILVVSCDCGYEATSFAPKQTWVCQGSTWVKSGQVKCQPKKSTSERCRPLESIEYGRVDVDWTARRVEYSCQAGSRLRGDAVRTCDGGKWTGAAPVCDHIQCGSPPEVRNAKVASNGTFFAGDSAQYACVGDFVPSQDGDFEATCDQNGQWNPTSAKCRSSECVVPELPESVNATYWYSQHIQFYFTVKPGDLVPNRAIMLSRCSAFNYRHFSGDSYRECNLGEWSGQEPNCSLVFVEDETHPQSYFSAEPWKASTYSAQGEMIVKEGAKLTMFCSSRFNMAWRGVFGNIFKTPGATITGNRPVADTPGTFENGIEIAKATGHHTNVYTCYRQDRPDYFMEFRVKVIP